MNGKNSEHAYKFTIFTPTYNRKETITDTFRSLCRQSEKDFEWIVIDDGSSDGTEEFFCSEEVRSAEFSIIYKYVDNSGKHVAQNKALDMAQGELFLPLDSDDTIVDDALDIMWKAWVSIPNNEREKYSGIGVHCCDSQGVRVGDSWPNDEIVSNDLAMHFKHKVRGEKWGPIRTDIMRQYKNEEVKGHFLSESTVWFRIAKKYCKLYLNESLRFYETHDDSVTKLIKKDNVYNLESELLADSIYINEFYEWYWKYMPMQAIKLPLRCAKRCIAGGKHLYFGEESYIKKVHPISAKILLCVAAPYWIINWLKQ